MQYCQRRADELADKNELVFAFFDEAELGNGLVFGDFGAINRDGVAGDEFARFTLAAGKASFGENVDKSCASFGGREALGE